VFNITLVYYIFSDAFISQSVSSSGAHVPAVKLANENGKVSIFLNTKSYFIRFNVHVDGSGLPAETATNFQGWTGVDSNLIVSATVITSVPYVNSFAGTVYTPNGKIDSTSTIIESDGDAVSYANNMLAVKPLLPWHPRRLCSIISPCVRMVCFLATPRHLHWNCMPLERMDLLQRPSWYCQMAQ